jgi:hypothetical protein
MLSLGETSVKMKVLATESCYAHRRTPNWRLPYSCAARRPGLCSEVTFDPVDHLPRRDAGVVRCDLRTGLGFHFIAQQQTRALAERQPTLDLSTWSVRRF